MASGNTLSVFVPSQGEPPATNFATLNTRNSILVAEFINGTTVALIFRSALSRNYAGGGITVSFHWIAKTATAGNVVWACAFERDNAANHDLDADAFTTLQTAAASAADGTSGKITVATVAVTNGANLDSLAVGEAFRLKVQRTTGGSDTLADPAQLIAVELKET